MRFTAFMRSVAIQLAVIIGFGALAGAAFGQDGFPEGFNPNPAADALGAGIILVSLLVGLAIGIAVAALIAFLVIKNYSAIPAEHRKMEPGKVWLMVIPLFGLYWNFPVFLGLADSYKSFFNSIGDESVGDCNRQLSLWFCITAAANVVFLLVPCLPVLVGLAALVLLILVLVKAFELKKKVESATNSTAELG